MYYVYILESLKDKGIYIGFCFDLKKRLIEHQQGKVKSTKSRLPVELVYYEAYKNKTDARKRELELKNKGQQREILKERIKKSLDSGPIV